MDETNRCETVFLQSVDEHRTFEMFETILLLTLTLIFLYKITVRPRNFPPGPVNLPLLGFVPFLGKRPYITLKNLSHKYGEIFSVNFLHKKMIVLNSFETIRDAFKEESFSGRPDLYFSYATAEGYHGLLFNEGPQWLELRRFVLRTLRDFGFGKSSIESTINNEVHHLILDLKKDAGTPIQVRNRFNLSIVNALWTITSGERFIHDDPNLRQLIANFSGALMTIDFSGLTSILPHYKHIPAKLIGVDKFLTQTTIAKGFMLELIKLRTGTFNNEAEDQNFVQTYLRTAEKSQSDPQSCFHGEIGKKNLEIVLLDLFMAGSETASAFLTWLVLLLSTYEDIQRRIQDEIDQVIGKDRCPSIADKRRMPYLEAVLLETHRYVTILPQGLVHKTTRHTVFRGYDIPKGTWVMPNLHAAHRDEKIWERPHDFYPQHFLTQDGKLKNMPQLIPFSTGRRVCLGESLAKMEIFLFAAGLLQNFKFTLPESGVRPSLELQPGLIMQPLHYKVMFSQRN